MKVRCDRKTLLEAATLVAGVTASRSTRPILQSILLSARGNDLELLASDLELSIRSKINLLACDDEGSVALPADTFLSILKETRGDSIDLSVDGAVALLRASGGQFRVTGERVEDFPEIPDGEGESFVEIPVDVFTSLSNRTDFSAAKDLGRYAINGILIELKDNSIRFVSTDGRRMAYAAADVSGSDQAFKEIVPLKGITQFIKAIGPEDKSVEIAMSNRRTLLRVGNALMCATSIEADFPDYENAIPPAQEPTVVLDRDPFFSAVRQAAVMAGDDARAVVLEFSEGSLTVSSRVEGRGDARSEIGANYVGEKVNIAFNPDYLLDFAKVSLPDELPFVFGDPSAAAVFRPDEAFVYVLMPIST